MSSSAAAAMPVYASAALRLFDIQRYAVIFHYFRYADFR